MDGRNRRPVPRRSGQVAMEFFPTLGLYVTAGSRRYALLPGQRQLPKRRRVSNRCGQPYASNGGAASWSSGSANRHNQPIVEFGRFDRHPSLGSETDPTVVVISSDFWSFLSARSAGVLKGLITQKWAKHQSLSEKPLARSQAHR